MYNEISTEFAGRRPRTRLHDQGAVVSLDAFYGRVQPHVNARLAQGRDELSDEIGIEPLERPPAAMDDANLGSGAGRDRGEFAGDVAAADEDDAPRQRLQVQELLTGGEQLLARDAEPARLRTGRDDDVARDQLVVVRPLALDAYARRPGEMCGPVIPLDAGLGEARLVLCRSGIGGRTRRCPCLAAVGSTRGHRPRPPAPSSGRSRGAGTCPRRGDSRPRRRSSPLLGRDRRHSGRLSLSPER